MALTLYRITATKKLVVVDSATPPSGGVAVTLSPTGNLVDTAPWTRTLDAATSHVADWHPAKYPPSTPEMFTSEAQLLSLNSSSQAFTYDGLNVLDPAGQSITFTTKLQNITNPVVWTSSPASLLTSTSNAGATLTAANFNSNTSVTVTATAGTNSDTITIVRLTDGSTVLIGYLTNESHTLPADSAGAVTVYTGATGTFKVYYGLSEVTSACTFAGVGVNCTGSVSVAGVYTVSSGIATGTDLSTYTLTATHPTYGVITKVFSISKSKAGVSAAIADLSNDNHTVPTDSSGSNGNFTGCVTTMSVFLGSTDDSANWTYAVTKSAGVTCTDTTSRTQAVTAMTSDTGTVTIVASKAGFASQTQVFSISKAKSGAAYSINLSNNSVRKSSLGALSPASLTLTASKIDVSGVTAYTGRFKIYLNGSGTATYTSATDEASHPYTVTGTDTTIKCELYLAGGTTTLVDTETVLVVADGTDGADGADGADGTNGTSVYTGTIYQQITTATAPSGGTYNFSTGTLTAPASWSTTPPTTTTTPTWACDYTFSTTTPATSVTALTWTNLHIDMVKGDTGITGTRTAVLDLYQWGTTTAPTLFPSGTSTYTWATGQFTNPATLNSWTQTPASPTAGQVLYVCHAFFADSLTTPTSPVTWSTTVAIVSTTAGTNGTPATYVTVTGEQAFKFATGSATPVSTSITLTAALTGLTAYQWDYWNGTGWATLSGTVNTSTYALAYNNAAFTANSLRVRCISGTAFDEITIVKLYDGTNGTNGTSVYTGTVYQQTASAPAAPSGGTYNFNTGVLTAPAGWTITQPATSTTPTYAVDFVFSTITPATAVTATTWTNVRIEAVAGSAGANGVSIHVVDLYQQAASAPVLPTGTAYNFSTDILTGTLGSWSRSVPASSTTPTYKTSCTFTVTAPTVSQTLSTWSTAVVIAQNGSNGTNGINGINATYVIVTGEQAFKFLAGSATPTSSTLTLTAALFGGLTTYSWQYWNGTTWVSLAAINNPTTPTASTSATYALAYNNAVFTASSLRIRCLSGTDFDEITILKLYDGATGTNGTNGVSAISGYLTNETCTVSTASDGTGASFTSAGGTFKMFNGITDVTATSTFTTSAAVSGLTLTIGAATGIYSLAGTWTSDSASFTLTGTFSGTVITKVYTITKSKAGAGGSAGANARAVDATTVAQIFNYTSAGITPSPATSVITATARHTTGALTYAFKNGATVLQAASATATYTYTPPASYSATADQITIELYEGGVLVATDIISMAGLKPGAAGLSGLLTNEAHVVSTAADGTGYVLTSAGGTFKVYSGNNDVTTASTFTVTTATVNGLTLAIGAATGIYTLSGSAWTTSDTESFTVNATYGGTVISKIYKISKSKTGSAGANAVSGYLTNETVAVATDSNGTGAVYTSAGGTFKVFNGITDVTTSTAFTTTAAVSGLTLTIGAATGIYSVAGTWTSDIASFTLTGVYNGTTITKVYKITKAKAGVAGGPGAAGDSVDIIFKRGVDATTAPTITSPSTNGGTGWTTTVPAATQFPLWSSKGFQTASTGNYTWEAPVKIEGANVAEVTIYTRTPSPTVPANTTGATYTFGIASPLALAAGSIWSVGIPSGTLPVYTSRAVVSAAAGYTAAVGITGWTTPVISLQDGTAGQRIGFLELYIWSAAAPTTYPSGTSTYTWSTGTFTAPATLNSWALVPATAVAGQSLWGISATISNTSTTATDTATWSSTAPYVVGYAGGNGVSINVVELYQQAASAPALPTGTSYEFSTDTLSGTLGSWVRTMPASSTTPTYMTVCTFTVTAPTTYQIRTSWSTAVIAAQNGVGSPGTRGSGEFYAVGSSWIDSTAANAVYAVYPLLTYPAGLVYGDTVTISNNSNFVNVRYWNGSTWTALGTVIDGSLIVTNSITAAKINSNGLSIKDASGNIILAAGSALDFSNVGGTTKPANNATVGATFGTNISGQITETTASTYIASLAVDTLQLKTGCISKCYQDVGTPFNPSGVMNVQPTNDVPLMSITNVVVPNNSTGVLFTFGCSFANYSAQTRLKAHFSMRRSGAYFTGYTNETLFYVSIGVGAGSLGNGDSIVFSKTFFDNTVTAGTYTYDIYPHSVTAWSVGNLQYLKDAVAQAIVMSR